MTVDAGSVRCTFFGTSSVHVTDGVSGVLIDGFFTRPSLLRVALGRPIAPDLGRTSDTLSRGGIERLDALFVAHSHHGHVMDPPEIVKRVGGVLYGSESTLNVGRGAGLGEQAMACVGDGDKHRSLDKKLRPMPRLLDNFAETKELLDRKSAESGLHLRFQKPYETISPFS